jgi:hypothetical protein
MTQFIERPVLKHIESLMEMELRLLHNLADSGGCRCFPDPGLDCFLLEPPPDDEVEWDSREAQEVLRRGIGRAWGLKDSEG